MGEYLQQHAGLHFTLGLVEVAFFQLPQGGYVAQPRVFVKTTNIGRGIVTFDDARLGIRATNEVPSTAASPVRKMSITKEQFLESLEQGLPGLSAKLNGFIDKLSAYDVATKFGKSMILRWHGDDTKGWNLGQIVVTGEFWTDAFALRAKESGLADQASQYLMDLAALVPGAYIRDSPRGNPLLTDSDRRIMRIDILLADTSRVEGWLHAITNFQTAIAQAA